MISIFGLFVHSNYEKFGLFVHSNHDKHIKTIGNNSSDPLYK
jgi:hypothetical protein